MNKHFLIFLIVTTIIFLSCKKEVSIKNVENQAELDSLIIENIKIPFDNYDTVFICKPFFETCGTILPEEQLEEFKRRYDVKFDSINYFNLIEKKINKPLFKWTSLLHTRYNSIIDKRIEKYNIPDSLLKLQRQIEDSTFYSNKVFVLFHSYIFFNDSISFSIRYCNKNKVLTKSYMYHFYNTRWDYSIIKTDFNIDKNFYRYLEYN